MSTYVIDGNILISYSGEEEIINIPSGIFKIGKNAFAGNKLIKKVIISDSVTVFTSAVTNSFAIC